MTTQPLDAAPPPAPVPRPRSFVESIPSLPRATYEPVLPYLWMVLGSFAFASMGAIAHRLRWSCDWQVIVLARVCLQLIFAALLAYLAGVPLLLWKPWALWIRSIAGSIGIVCTFYAYTRLPVAEALTLNTMFPIWVALFSWPLLKQLPSLSVWLAVASGMAGVVLMQQPQLTEGNFASLVALASSFFTAIAMIALNRLQGIDPRTIIAHFSAVAVLVSIVSYFTFAPARAAAAPVSALLAEDASRLDGTALVLFLLLGVGVVALVGQLFLTKAFTTGNAAKVAVVNLTQIVFAMIFDVFLFGHQAGRTTLLGMALVIVPTAWLMMERAKVPAEEGREIDPHDNSTTGEVDDGARR